MSAPVELDADVIVVELGPVGATLVGLLADLGVRVLAFERSREVYPLPRAAHVDYEIMRVFQSLGIIDSLQGSIRVAESYAFRTAAEETLLQFDPEPTSVSGWASGYMIHQPCIEQALRAKLMSAPNVSVHLGAEVAGVSQTRECIDAEIVTDGIRSVVRAKYLVACGGASSPIREAMGVGFDDLSFDEPWLVIDALASEAAPLPNLNLQVCDPARPTTSVLMPAGRHRWEFMLLEGETPEGALEDAFTHDLLRSWAVEGHVRIERKAVYRFHGLIADRWRVGRVLLAGDAAHQMPPFAGQGLCSGVRDAANLARKLAAVLSGRAPQRLLDTYHSGREPHVRAYVDLAIGMGKVVCVLDPAQAAARDAAMLAQRAVGISPLPPLRPPGLGAGVILAGTAQAGAYFPQPWSGAGNGELRLDDVLGPGAWLIWRGAKSSLVNADVRAVDVADALMAPFAPAVTGWLDAAEADAVLLRPDRYVFGTGDAQHLLAAYQAALQTRELEAA